MGGLAGGRRGEKGRYPMPNFTREVEVNGEIYDVEGSFEIAEDSTIRWVSSVDIECVRTIDEDGGEHEIPNDGVLWDAIEQKLNKMLLD